MSAARYREIQDLRTERTKRSEFRSHVKAPVKAIRPQPSVPRSEPRDSFDSMPILIVMFAAAGFVFAARVMGWL